jgi:hypothetical protein
MIFMVTFFIQDVNRRHERNRADRIGVRPQRGSASLIFVPVAKFVEKNDRLVFEESPANCIFPLFFRLILATFRQVR